jgi:cystathionine gamma-synthase
VRKRAVAGEENDAAAAGFVTDDIRPDGRRHHNRSASSKLRSCRQLKSETIAAQAGGAMDAATGAIVPPVHVATTFVRSSRVPRAGQACYGRADNPTVHCVEDVLCQLEAAADTLMFSSGTAAACVAVLSLPKPAHIVAPTSMYWGFRQWLRTDAGRLGIETTFVDTADHDALTAAMRRGQTQMVWIETPSNPLCEVTDIAAAAHIAHAHGALLFVDSTVSTPVLTTPIALGADVVLHSATKYLNGHSDVVAGALCFRSNLDALVTEVARLRLSLGGVIGGHEAALLLRGMRTLHLRVRHQSASALAIARHFEGHPALSHILYPGLRSHPGHGVAAMQMAGGFGGLLSMRFRGGKAAAVAAIKAMKLWRRATSLGGTESLVEHRASMEGAASPCPRDLLRFAVGIESADDLIADLEQAFAKAGRS